MNSKQFAGLSWPDEETEKLIVQRLIDQKLNYDQWNIGKLLAMVIGERNAAMWAVRTYTEVIEANKVANERILKSHQVKATYTKAEVIRELNNQLTQIVEEVASRMLAKANDLKRKNDARDAQEGEKFVARDCINWSNNDHCAVTKCNYCYKGCKAYRSYKGGQA